MEDRLLKYIKKEKWILLVFIMQICITMHGPQSMKHFPGKEMSSFSVVISWSPDVAYTAPRSSQSELLRIIS
jgi:hypothetical protein